MILAGRVRLNGATVELGQKADPTIDRIEVDGMEVRPNQRPESIYLLLHKPQGIVSTCRDPQRRKTVLDLLPAELQNQGLHLVGRLDADSTGALLLTNDGNLTFYLTHPRHSIVKTYRVRVQGTPTESDLQRWRDGIPLAGQMTRPSTVRVLQPDNNNRAVFRTEAVPNAANTTLLEVRLREGRNRQIRRVAAILGYPVLRLHRVAIGAVELGSLATGHYRFLTPTEITMLQAQLEHDRRQAQSGINLISQHSISGGSFALRGKAHG